MINKKFYGVFDRKKLDVFAQIEGGRGQKKFSITSFVNYLNRFFLSEKSEPYKSERYKSIVKDLIKKEVYLDALNIIENSPDQKHLVSNLPKNSSRNYMPIDFVFNNRVYVLNSSLIYDVSCYFFEDFLAQMDRNANSEFNKILSKMDLIDDERDRISFVKNNYKDLYITLVDNEKYFQLMMGHDFFLHNIFEEELVNNNFPIFIYLTVRDKDKEVYVSFDDDEFKEPICRATKNSFLCLKLKKIISELEMKQGKKPLLKNVAKPLKKSKTLKELFVNENNFNIVLNLLIENKIVRKIAQGYEVVIPKKYRNCNFIYICSIAIQLMEKKYISRNECTDAELYGAFNSFFCNADLTKQNFNSAANSSRLNEYLKCTSFLPKADNTTEDT